MPRNLDRRVETLFPVQDEALARRLRWDILEAYLLDNAKSWLMQPDGTYVRLARSAGEPVSNAQESFLEGRIIDKERRWNCTS